jgi:RecB family endonuclease NucS
VRLVVARCEVVYSGRLNAYLPPSTRLLVLKADGSVLVHADAGGFKPQTTSAWGASCRTRLYDPWARASSYAMQPL